MIVGAVTLTYFRGVFSRPCPVREFDLFGVVTREGSPMTHIFIKLSDRNNTRIKEVGTVTAIHKKENQQVAGNYRPISLAIVVCNTMERLVKGTPISGSGQWIDYRCRLGSLGNSSTALGRSDYEEAASPSCS